VVSFVARACRWKHVFDQCGPNFHLLSWISRPRRCLLLGVNIRVYFHAAFEVFFPVYEYFTFEIWVC
jgi:hypothetical protein